jgi:RNA polymerase sigma-70 factor (ECF subfamily)
MNNDRASLTSWPDRDLVVAFKGGVPEAYDEMYRRYSARVGHVCYRMLGSAEDAREATQETFLKAYLALPRFNGQYQLGAWLTRIATNVCVDNIRRRGRTAPVTPLTENHEGTRTEIGPEEVVLRDAPALSTLESLQPLHARALDLRNLQGLSHKEIAVQLGMSPAQVKALLHRARLSFKRAWDNASSWALAPLVGLRHLLPHSMREPSGLSVQLPVWTQAAGPLVIEKVAASAMVVAIAISGAASTTSPSQPSTQAPQPIAQAAGPGVGDTPPLRAMPPRQRQHDLVADVTALVDDVQKVAEEHSGDKGSRGKGRSDDGGNVGPSSADRASQKLVKKVNDTAEDVLPDH